MLDLGTSFLASVARDPSALAIVDGNVRLSYQAWYEKISALVAAFDDLRLKPGDHLVTLLQNNWQAATIHWACQLAGIVVTPVNWRAKEDEIDFYLDNAEARALAYQDVSAAAVAAAKSAGKLPRIAVTIPGSADVDFAQLAAAKAADATPRVDAEAWSLMLYTSGTTSRPKGVRAGTAPSGPPPSPTWRKTFTRTASARSASLPSTTPWASARCSLCR
jgi:2-furoate---CoA ligase